MAVNTCYICMMKYSIIFSSLSYSFVKFNCPHSKKPSRKPRIRCAPNRQRLGFLLQILAIILGVAELFIAIKTEDITDNTTILNILSLTSTISVTYALLKANWSWKALIDDMKTAMYISEFLSKFIVDDKWFRVFYVFSVGWMGYSSLYYSSQLFFMWVGEPINYLLYLKSINLSIFGYLMSTFILRIIVDTSVNIVFMQRLFAQLDRELSQKLRELDIRYICLPQATFARKIRTLRRFYMAVLVNFQRTRIRFNSSLEILVMSNFIIAIWIMAITCVILIGRRTLSLSEYIIILWFGLRTLFVYCFAIVCDFSNILIKKQQTALFKFPSEKLSSEEKIELENFVKLLVWREPMKTVRDSYRFGISTVAGIGLNIVVNSMVVTQLYIFFDNQLNSK
ncbi:unnamed protein product [Phyllotreta striolata]|uniref:Uncharacterized protein n=1 Tax=Phyllotreta striolata TaxID=444603 RepID=A0A9N9TF90_PHYSR|nr:unnamed protein product [Phyllotreta striolata]